MELRVALKDASEEQITYHRTGTHWNDFGALRAAQAILAELSARHAVLSVPRDDEFEQRRETGPARSFLSLVGLQHRVREDYVFLDPRKPRTARTIRGEREPDEDGSWSYIVRATGRKELPRAAVFHDSFVHAGLEPFLSERFEAAAYHWGTECTWQLVKKDRPDLVIEEHAERFFLRDANPKDAKRAGTRRR